MAGGPTLAVEDIPPQVTQAQATAALSVIYSQPRHEWRMFARMLGLTGEPINLHRKPGGTQYV